MVFGAGFGCSGGQVEVFTLAEHGPAHAGVLRGNGHDGLPVTTPLLKAHRPAADWIALVLGRCQHCSGTKHQQAAQVRVTRFGDAPQALLAARAVLPGHQAQPGAQLAATLEIVPVANSAEQRRGGGGPDAAQLHQAFGLGAVTRH